MRGCSPDMCEWMATMLIPPWRSALSTSCSSGSSMAKSPSMTALSSVPASAAQVFTPMVLPMVMPRTLVVRPQVAL